MYNRAFDFGKTMMTGKITALLAVSVTALSLVFATAAQGEGLEYAPEITVKDTVLPLVGMIALPGCTDSKGVTANYIKYSETDDMVWSPLASSGMGYDGKPEIIYDDEWMPYIPELAQKFVLGHECRHIKNDDLTIIIELNEAFARKKITKDELKTGRQALEDRADCEAVQELKNKYNLADKQIDAVINSISPMLKYYGAIDDAIAQRRASLHRCYVNPILYRM